jgi:ABC-type cobalamin/Fe3+-siderophores transport system ATPase subunit
VLELLRARQRESGLTIVWATHDLALAGRFADATLDLDEERPDVRLRAS